MRRLAVVARCGRKEGVEIGVNVVGVAGMDVASLARLYDQVRPWVLKLAGGPTQLVNASHIAGSAIRGEVAGRCQRI